MSKKVLFVIGERMGKGQKVAEGIRQAGGECHVIPGMAADMKLGTVMHEKGADIGLSFCGSGGAGALMAANQFGYKAKHHLRSVGEGETAIRQGYQVLGFGFMDTEELGRKLCEAYYDLHGKPDAQ